MITAQQVIKRPIKAVLVQPPNVGGVRSLLSHMNEEGESIGFKPPLGLLYIATYLKEHTPHEVSTIDAWAERLDMEECVKKISEQNPDVVGISAWTDWWYAAYLLGRMLKEKMPNLHICYGGPHVNIYPEETLSAQHVDSIVAGDGEVPFARLCDMAADGTYNNAFTGLHLKKYGVKKGEELYFVQQNLDDLPIPDRKLLPLQNYTSVLGASKFITTMITSRGCPYRCIYCKLHYQKTLTRSAENVVEEFKKIYDLGVREVELYDDTFTWSKNRVLDICRGISEKNITISWAVRDRVNMAEKELLAAMKEAGCTRIHYGIESGVDRILSLMQKNITTTQARDAMRNAKDLKFTVLAYFMLGNKGETRDDIMDTIDFALELDADYAEFSVTIPYPGTQLYFEALDKGIIKNDYWREFAINPVPDFQIPRIYEENLKLAELLSLRNEAIRRYYFRPRYIFKEMSKLRNFGEFRRKARMGLRLISSIFKK